MLKQDLFPFGEQLVIDAGQAGVVDDVMDDNGVPLIGRVELGVLRPEKTGPRSFPPVWPKRP